MKKTPISLMVFGLSLSLSCQATPPPSAPASTNTQASDESQENEALRAQLTEVSERLAQTSDERNEASRERDECTERIAAAADEKKSAIEKPTRMRSPDADVAYSAPLNDGVIDGRADALVTIVVATEAACPFCWKAEATLDEIRKAYKNDVRIVYQNFVVHPQVATESALAFCAAGRQNKGLKMWRAIGKQYEIYRSEINPEALARPALIAAAKKARLNTKRLVKDMDGACAETIKKQQSHLGSLGVGGTPSFFINGKNIRGAQPLSTFTPVIDAELERALELVAGGIDRKSVYAAIVAFGKKSLH